MFESPIYCIEEVFLAKGFIQKIHRAGLKGSRSRVAICVGRDEDDRYMPVGRNHLTLELESVHARHSHVENHACRIMRLI
jgi:hypothetical protein